jgi:hypothetical protein
LSQPSQVGRIHLTGANSWRRYSVWLLVWSRVRTHKRGSQKRIVAASAMADMKVWAHRS